MPCANEIRGVDAGLLFPGVTVDVSAAEVDVIKLLFVEKRIEVGYYAGSPDCTLF